MRDQLANSLREIGSNIAYNVKETFTLRKEDSPHKTSEKIGVIGTLGFWFIMLICFAFIKPIEKKPKYKEVQIVLSSTPVQKRAEESPAPAAPAPAPASATEAVVESQPSVPVEAAPVPTPAPAPVVEQPKKVAKPVEKPAEKPVAKTSTKPAAKPIEKTAAKPVAKSEPVELAKSVEDLMAEQFANKKSSKSADFDPFAQFDDDDFEETAAVTKTVSNNTPAFSGSAATATTSANQPVKSASTNSKSANQTSSNTTSSALGKISNAKFFGTASSSVDTESTVQTTASGNDKVSMVMENGSSRILLEPSKPVINLSEAAAATIDGSRKVKIKFTVTESGNVPRGEILITPESSLSELVRKEIRDQISKWRFETADDVSKATFEYNIVKYND